VVATAEPRGSQRRSIETPFAPLSNKGASKREKVRENFEPGPHGNGGFVAPNAQVPGELEKGGKSLAPIYLGNIEQAKREKKSEH